MIAIAYIVIMAPVLLSGLMLTTRRQMKPSLQRALTLFGGAFLLAICFLDLIPEAYEGSAPVKWVAAAVMVGLLTQIMLEYLTQGVGHNHAGEALQTSAEEPTVALTGLMTGLCLHAFFEGIPLVSPQADGTLPVDWGLAIGITLHNIPISLMLLTLFIGRHYSNRKSLLLLLLFAIMTPVGSLVGLWTLREVPEAVRACIIAFVIGILLHVSQNLLLDHHGQHFAWRDFGIITLAFALALCI